MMNGGMYVDTSVIVITRDELPYLRDTLVVLGQTLGDEAGEYIVVDDGSQDGTKEWLAGIDAVRLIHHTEKKGWMSSLNEGINIAHGKHILVLRGGTLMPHITWMRLKAALGEDRTRGAQAGVVFSICNRAYEGGKQHEEIACDALEALERTASASPEARDEATVYLDGHCMLMRRAAWQAVGGLRESYGDYKEGYVDFSLRLWKNGLATRRCPMAVVQVEEAAVDSREKAAAERDGQVLLAEQWHIRPGYSLQMRRDLLADFDYSDPDFSMLVAGCACGMDLMYVHDTYPDAELQGIELDPHSAAIATTFAPVENIDIETLDRPDWQERFSAVLMGDILEHLRDPWKTMRRMYEYTRPGGRISISLPNVSHISILGSLLRAHWQYEGDGVLDRTHLRFFARNEAVDLVTQAGYHIKEVRYRKVPISEEMTKLRKALLPLLQNGAQPFDLDAYQWLIVGEK